MLCLGKQLLEFLCYYFLAICLHAKNLNKNLQTIACFKGVSKIIVFIITLKLLKILLSCISIFVKKNLKYSIKISC